MQQLDNSRIPAHVAIIMDGNGRWAKAKGMPRTAGHVEGVATVKKNYRRGNQAWHQIPDALHLQHRELE